jgi:threonine dehydrogenase-like Zn-dependent dehydrogenase
MKALVWHGTTDIRCESVPDPSIEHERDAIIKVTSCAICGSDLHLYDHFMPGMKSGDIMGHETMGEVVEVGSAAKGALKVGDRVVIPFTIICGECDQCQPQKADPASANAHMRSRSLTRWHPVGKNDAVVRRTQAGGSSVLVSRCDGEGI